MVPFEETINTKQELIEACKRGFEDYSNRRISKNDFCMYFGFTHGEAITKFYKGDYEQLLIDGGFNSGSGAYFSGGINAWKNLRDGKYVFPPFIQNNQLPNTMVTYPIQKIYYGCPGSGKSYKVKEITDAIDTDYVFRTTFHPDTDYASFVGCYKPSMLGIISNYRYKSLQDLKSEADVINSSSGDKVSQIIAFVTKYANDLQFIVDTEPNIKSLQNLLNKNLLFANETYLAYVVDYVLKNQETNITYKFSPQIFTNAYVQAWKNPNDNVYLIIEEINRGNCAQIFGDLFQLLDRDKVTGKSEYPIKADKDLVAYIEKELGVGHEGIKNGELCLPSNLIIYATMNTSDQSLFPMDSAFKRRWDWEYVPINYSKDIDSGKFIINIDGAEYLWVDFLEKVNDKIYDATNSEDKQMGNFFIKKSVDAKEFINKVMFYLWNEVCKEEYGTQRNFFRKGKEGKTEFKFTELFGINQTMILNEFMTSLGIELTNKPNPEEPAVE